MQATQQLKLLSDSSVIDPTTGSVFFIGNATTIIRYAGFAVLTDPNFLHRHEKVALGYGLRSRRLTDPAIDLEDLPPIDLVLLSHLHEDHFDRKVERELDKSLPIVTTVHAASALRKKGFSAARSLKTWQTISVRKGEAELRITAMPGTHAPGILSKLLPPVMGSLLQFYVSGGEPRVQMYITGDTLVHEQLKEIPQRFPHIDLALLHLGGTRVLGLMVTMDAKQGVEVLQLMNPDRAIPIHYNDYTVFTSSLSDFKTAVDAAGLSEKVRYLKHGDRYTFRLGEPG